MDNQTENTQAARKRGPVRDFANLPEGFLERLRLDAGLDMPVHILRQLQRHYQSNERREPLYDELYFLDRYLATRRAGDIPVSELLTNEQYIAETYADLLAKRDSINRNMTPLTPDMASRIVGRYLERSGRRPDLDRRVVIAAGEDTELRLILGGVHPMAVTDYGAAGFLQLPEPKPGNILIILCPAPGMTRGVFTAAVVRVLQASGVGLPRGAVVGRAGIAGAVAGLFEGAHVNLMAIPGLSAPCELEELCGSAHGAVLIATEPSRSGSILAAAAAENLPAATAGGILYNNKLMVKYSPSIPVSLSMDLIYKPARYPAEKYIVREQKRAEISNIVTSRCHDPASGLLLATAHSPGNCDPFFMSHDTVLTAVAGCVAGGADFTGVSLSLCGSIPAECSEPQARGDILALILGAYRAQIEYCLPDAGSLYTFSEQGFSFTAAAAALPEGKLIPATFRKPGSRVYLLSPATRPDGLPDYEELRRIWRYVADIGRAGLVSSAAAIGADGAAGAIRAMSGDVVFEPADNTDLLQKPMPGGIIIESDALLEGVRLGKTKPAGGYISI